MLSLSVHGENHRTVCMIVSLFPSYNWNQSQLRLILIRNKIDPDQAVSYRLLLDYLLLTIRRIH